MKKMNNVYSTSDFAKSSISTLVDETKWVIDSVDCTAVGEFSKVPLFEVQLRRLIITDETDDNGWRDASQELEPNRTYFVREGKPLFNKLASVWEATEDRDAVEDYVLREYSNKYFVGRVERLSGVSYTYKTKRGTIVQRSKLEVWYPSSVEEGVILDDFVFLCNKGVYVPVIERTPVLDPLTEAIKGLDPAVIAAIKAMK